MKKKITDLEIAKDLLYQENLTICIVKNGSVIHKSSQKGIYPMYEAITEKYQELEGASVADRVIGRAAAMLNVYAKTEYVFSEIVSKSAVTILHNNKINLSYNKSVAYIKNRSQDDLCPIEKISSKVADTDYKILMSKIKEFLISVKILQEN